MIHTPVRGMIHTPEEMASAAVDFVERGSGLLVAWVADALILAQAFEHDLRGLDRLVRLLIAAEWALAAYTALAGRVSNVLGPDEGRSPRYRARALGWFEAPPLLRRPDALMVGKKRQPVEVGPRLGHALWPSPMCDDDKAKVDKLGQRRRYLLLLDTGMGRQLDIRHGELSVVLTGVPQVLDDQAI